MEEVNYSVTIEKYSKSHFIKSFEKKYKDKWDMALGIIQYELQRIDNLLNTDKADIITQSEEFKIVKVQFSIPGTKQSPKASGNRCIVGVDEKKQIVSVLLVYSKTDISGKNETA